MFMVYLFRILYFNNVLNFRSNIILVYILLNARCICKLIYIHHNYEKLFYLMPQFYLNE